MFSYIEHWSKVWRGKRLESAPGWKAHQAEKEVCLRDRMLPFPTFPRDRKNRWQLLGAAGIVGACLGGLVSGSFFPATAHKFVPHADTL